MVDQPPAPADMDYEQARAALETVVRRLEAGGATLEESLTLWESGEELAAVCERRLEGARARLHPNEPAAQLPADQAATDPPAGD